MVGVALTAVLVVGCAAATGLGALVLARGVGRTRLLGAIPGLGALAAITALQAGHLISEAQWSAASAAIVLVAAVVTLVVRRRSPR
ncbi:hypothetical protein ASD06_06210 [Angustibacter sp. Root456]|nr:hypothetical protein ASD06_06210 [Angustibacter sp. Root456]